MPEIHFEVYCDCGNGLCQQTKVDNKRGGVVVIIEPCERCLKNAKDEGYEDGYSDGETAGKASE